ncbi:MAG: glycosyltransferase family 39 protein [Candidatus Omnitrophota bacterium]
MSSATDPLSPKSLTDIVTRLSLAGILAGIVTKIHLAFQLNIHWDEFYFLSRIYEYLRGGPVGVFQTFHVHLFSWLTALPFYESGQVVAGRMVMVVLAVLSSGLIYRIGRIYLNRAGAFFSVLCYFAFSNILVHGASFRADPLGVFLFLAAAGCRTAVIFNHSRRIRRFWLSAGRTFR